MAIFAAIQKNTDAEKVQELLPNHLAYLQQLIADGKIKATGPFVDGSGGMILYLADSLEEAQQLAGNDPFIKEGVSEVEIREWVDMTESL